MFYINSFVIGVWCSSENMLNPMQLLSHSPRRPPSPSSPLHVCVAQADLIFAILLPQPLDFGFMSTPGSVYMFSWCPESANAEKQNGLVVVKDWGRAGQQQSWLSPSVGGGKVVGSLVACAHSVNVLEINELRTLWGWVLQHVNDIARQWNINESGNSEAKSWSFKNLNNTESF